MRLPLKGPLSHCWEICFRKNRHLRWYPPRSGSHTTWTRATPGLTRAWASSPTPPAVCLPDWVRMFLPCPVGSDSGKHRWPLIPGSLFKSLHLSLWRSECGSWGPSEPPSAWYTQLMSAWSGPECEQGRNLVGYGSETSNLWVYYHCSVC